MFLCLQHGIRALSQLKYLEELNISHLEAVNSLSVEEALGKEVRPSLTLLNLASLSLEWKVVASLATVAPNLTHLDISMCVSGVNDRCIQVSGKKFLVGQTIVLCDLRNPSIYDKMKEDSGSTIIMFLSTGFV